MKYLTILLLMCGLAFGQTIKSHHKIARSCTTNLKDVSAERDAMKAHISALQIQNDQLMIAKNDTQNRLDAALKAVDDIEAASRTVLNYATSLQTEYTKTVTSYNQLTEKYNSLLTSANQQMALANEQLARQRRINNNLAIYSLMPKYVPITPPAPPPVSNNVNCLSTKTGDYVLTTCN